MNKIFTSTMLTMALAACSPSASVETDSIGRTTEFADSSHQFTPEVMWQMGRIGNYQLTADAQKAVYGVTYYSVEQNKSRAVIYATTPSTDNAPVALTDGASSEYAPSFIPGTDKVAYLAADKDGTMQLWMMLTDGSNRKQISFEATDVNDYLFSPCGKKVILIKTVNHPVKRIAHIIKIRYLQTLFIDCPPGLPEFAPQSHPGA